MRETLIRQGDLTRQQIEAESAEDAAERRDGDKTVGGACLVDRETGNQTVEANTRIVFFLFLRHCCLSHSDKRRRLPGVAPSHHPAGLHGQLVHRLRRQKIDEDGVCVCVCTCITLIGHADVY